VTTCEVSLSRCVDIVFCVTCHVTADSSLHVTSSPLRTTDVRNNKCVALGNGKGKDLTLLQVTKTQKKSRGIAVLFLGTRCGGQRQAPAALPQGSTRYPFHRRLGGPQGWSGRVCKTSPQPRFDPRMVQPVGSRDTD